MNQRGNERQQVFSGNSPTSSMSNDNRRLFSACRLHCVHVELAARSAAFRRFINQIHAREKKLGAIKVVYSLHCQALLSRAVGSARRLTFTVHSNRARIAFFILAAVQTEIRSLRLRNCEYVHKRKIRFNESDAFYACFFRFCCGFSFNDPAGESTFFFDCKHLNSARLGQ